MNKTIAPLVPLTLAFCAGTSQSQSVTVYGSVDTGVEYLTNVGASEASLTRIPSNTASGPSRLGFRGIEDLGGGISAEFNLEMGVLPDTGGLGQGGRTWGRYSYVGLVGPWGRVHIGRFYTNFFWAGVEADVLGPNIYGLASLDGYLAGARVDNAISYRGTFSGLTIGANASLGRDTVGGCGGEIANNQRACSEWSGLVKYDAAGWGIAYGIDTLHGGPGASGGLSSSERTDRRQMLNGYVKFSGGRASAGLIRRDNEGSATTPRSDLFFVGLRYALTPQLSFDGEISRLSFARSANEATMLAVRASYALSKRTAVYVTAGHISNDGLAAISVSSGAGGANPTPGNSQTGLMAGLRHNF